MYTRTHDTPATDYLSSISTATEQAEAAGDHAWIGLRRRRKPSAPGSGCCLAGGPQPTVMIQND